MIYAILIILIVAAAEIRGAIITRRHNVVKYALIRMAQRGEYRPQQK